MTRHSPRRQLQPLGAGMRSFVEGLAPATGLAAIQAVWVRAVGEGVASHATPTAERAGVVTVTCEAAVWAQELDLMGPELVSRINAALGAERVLSLRCTAAPAKAWRRG
jgi:predicted nucleic acid-binding Zn ribbon protein